MASNPTRKVHAHQRRGGQSFTSFCREHDPVFALNERLLRSQAGAGVVPGWQADMIHSWQVRQSAGRMRRGGVLTPNGVVAFNNVGSQVVAARRAA